MNNPTEYWIGCAHKARIGHNKERSDECLKNARRTSENKPGGFVKCYDGHDNYGKMMKYLKDRECSIYTAFQKGERDEDLGL